jgi:hypothetical protein
MAKYAYNPVCLCPDCGGRKIWMALWCDPNEDSIRWKDDPPVSEFVYCLDCDTTFKRCDIAYEKVELIHSGEEGNQDCAVCYGPIADYLVGRVCLDCEKKGVLLKRPKGSTIL